jgi:hypothetical protein
MRVWRWAKICACVLSLSCAAESTGTQVWVRVETDGRAVTADHLLFSWLECRTFLERDRRVPDSGELAAGAVPLASIVVRLDIQAPTRRGILIKGLVGSTLVSLGTAVVDVPPGVVTTATVRLYALPEDSEVDGLPQALDWCPPPAPPDAAAPADAAPEIPDVASPEVNPLEPDAAEAAPDAGPPVNAAPVVGAGTEVFAGRAGADVELHGAVSDDGLPGGPITATWSQVSGPGMATFADPAAPATTVKFSRAGTYVIRLTAYDGELRAHADLTATVLELGQALAAMWHFDEGRGGTAADGSGGGNAATLVGAGWGEGRLGGFSLDCSGPGGRAVVPDAADGRLDFGPGDFTMSAWVRLRGRSLTPNVIVKWPVVGSASHGGAALGLSLGSVAQFKALSDDQTFSVQGGGIADGRWHHLAGRKTNGALRVYLDGNASARASHAVTSVSNDEPLQIGGFGQNALYDFDGLIDEVALWSRALSDQELAGLAAGASP